jgi:CheY-like chemotaxis protein
LHVTVTDTGIGIPPETLPLIFAPFVQADSSITRKYGGTGLGLTITSRLVEMMSGRIWVESEVSRGSTFHFTVTLGVPEHQAAQAPPAPADLRGVAALVVDDNATNRLLLQEMLASWEMRPSTVDGAKAALAELERAASAGQPYPVVLLDACMPETDGFTLAGQIRNRPHLAGAALMMLSSADRQGDSARCRELGITHFLTKPIKQSDLLDALQQLVGPLSLRPDKPATEPPSRSSLPALPTLRILLAEDNPINQKVSVRVLERAGHQVTVVENGVDAVQAVQAVTYDLVLMDVQMPEMGGLEATRAIRSWERGRNRHVPIIAMTARAMKGDRELCLDAGMDGYVSKPILVQELLEAMHAVLGVRPAAAELSSSADGAVFDPDPLLNRIGGDRQLLVELIALFQKECPRLRQQLEQALARSDAPALSQAAHSLKGTVSNFAAGEAVLAAQQLETLARSGDLAGSRAVFQELDQSLKSLQAGLEKWLQEAQAACDGQPAADTANSPAGRN